MASCFSCLGRSRASDQEEPLLPDYHRHDDTHRQQALHRKLHSYQMFRALTKGAMPSTEQLVVQLRSLLASDVLNPADATLSDSGRLLAKHSRALLRQLIDLLLNKNRGDALQDLIWCLYCARLADHLPRPSWQSLADARAQTSATAQSIRTLSSLLLTNSDFRLFLSDLQTVGRQIFRDVAFSASTAAEHVGEQVDPSRGQSDAAALVETDTQAAPSNQGLAQDAKDIGAQVAKATAEVADGARESAQSHLSGSEKRTLLQRLQAAALKLRQRPDYKESVSTLSIVVRHYALNYVVATEATVDAAKGNIKADPYVTAAIESLSSILTSFGNARDWQDLKVKWEKCLRHIQHDPDFEEFVDKAVFALQKVFMDPALLAESDAQDLSQLREAFLEKKQDRAELQADVDALLEQLKTVWTTVINDNEVLDLTSSVFKVAGIFSPEGHAINAELTNDIINVLAPLAISSIQFIPIPRLELSTPDVDLLLENLILEPGKTVNASSFLPFRFRVETYNDVELRKARFGVTSRTTSLATVKLDGLSLRADELGFLLRMHSGFLKFADAGIASFALDQRGIDIHLDVEIGRDRLEHVLSLRRVRVKVHKLTYTLRKSKFACLAWVFKPLITLVVRKTLEAQLASAIADACRAANRELLFMRERLRATRISQPQDLATFAKAVLARLTPADDPDVAIRLAVGPPRVGVFAGEYAPGSIVKTWVEEGARAGEVVEDYQRDGWRNGIFDALPPL